MDEKKNGSQALETTGTDLSAITNISTSSTVYQGESYAKAEMDAVNIVVETARSSSGLHMCSLGELADEVVRTMRDIVESVNIPANLGGRNLGWSKPKTITAVQAAMLVFEYERIRMVCTKETVKKPTAEGVLAMYVDKGKDAGIYREIGDGQIDEWCSEIAGAVNKSWKESMQGVSGTSKTGAKHYYYYCKSQRHGKCKKKPIRKAVIEYLVQNALRLLLRDTENVAYLAHEAAEYYKSYYVDTGYLEGLESELKAVDKALDNLIKALEKGFFGDRLQERMTELENRKKALTDTIAAERIRREAIEDEHTIYAYFQKFLNANLDDPEVRDTVLEGLVDKIFLYDGYFEITGFYSDDRTVIEWDEVEDGQIEYSGFIEPADEFDDFAVGSTKN